METTLALHATIAQPATLARYAIVNSIIRKMESHRFEIAVFGRVSSGKSSLIGRLLGIKLFPVEITSTLTIARTAVKPG